MGQQPTEPGWYDDPQGAHKHHAYWDGEKWTGQTRSPRRSVGSLVVATVIVLGLLTLVIVPVASWIGDRAEENRESAAEYA